MFIRNPKLHLIILSSLLSLGSLANEAAAENLSRASEIHKLKKELELQRKKIDYLMTQIEYQPTKDNTAPPHNPATVPAKYVPIPSTGSGISFIVRPRLDFIHDLGNSPGDLMNANRIPLKQGIDPSIKSRHNNTMHARGTQLGFRTISHTKEGDEISTHVEIDFFGNQTAGGANIASSYDPRLRFAYLNYRGWTAGQTNSLWRDPDTEGSVIDYQGSIGAFRQAQLSYAHTWKHGFSSTISIERPLTDTMIRTDATEMTTETAPVNGFSNRTGRYGQTSIPDVLLSLKQEGSWGYANLRGLYRSLKVNYFNSASSQNYSPKKNPYGIGIAAKINTYGKSNIFGQANFGKGIGRYFPEMVGQSAFLDVRLPGSEKINLIKANQFIIGGQYFWNDSVQTNIVYTTTHATAPNGILSIPKNDTSTNRFNKRLEHIHLNTIWAVTKEFDLGLEYAYGGRKTFENYKGTVNRVTLMLRYTL